jgi:hypothetical protein
MLAQRMPSILPPMTDDESLDVTAIYSIAGLLGNEPRIVHRRPFRAPHHTSSRIALSGGVCNPLHFDKSRFRLTKSAAYDSDRMRAKDTHPVKTHGLRRHKTAK